MKSITMTLASLAFLSTSALAATNSTSTTTEEAKKKEPLLKLNFYSEMYADAADINRNDNSGVASYNYLGFTHKLNKTESLQLRAVFETAPKSFEVADIDASFAKAAQSNKTALDAGDIETRSGTVKDSQEFGLGDWVLRYSNSKASFLGEDASAQVRIYMPTSDASKETGKWSLRMYGIKPIGKIGKTDLSALFIPRFIGYTRDHDGQNNFDGIVSFDTSTDITDSFSVSTSTYLRKLLYNNGQRRRDGGKDLDGNVLPDTFAYNDDNDRTLGYMELYLSFKASDALTVMAYGSHSRDLNSDRRFVLFDEDETSYGLILSAGLQ